MHLVKALIALSLVFSQATSVELTSFQADSNAYIIPKVENIVGRENNLKTGYGIKDKYGNHYPYSYYLYKDDPDKLEAYRTIYNGLHDMQDTISLSHLQNVSASDVSEIYKYLIYDTTDLYYVDDKDVYVVSVGDDKPFCMNVKYLYTPKEVETYNNQLKGIVNLVKSNTPENISWYDLYVYLHDFITQNVSYNYNDMDEPTNSNVIGALINKTCTCHGYTMAFNYLCRAYGITTAVGTGMGGEAHIWSVVPYQGEWYNIDNTYDDNERLNKYSFHENFMLSDEALYNSQGCKNYKEGESGYYPSPKCDDSSKAYYITAESYLLVKDSLNNNQLAEEIVDRLLSNEEMQTTLLFKTTESYNKADNLLQDINNAYINEALKNRGIKGIDLQIIRNSELKIIYLDGEHIE